MPTAYSRDRMSKISSNLKFREVAPSDESCAYIIITLIKIVFLLFIVYFILLIPTGSAWKLKKLSHARFKVRNSRYYTKEFLCTLCDACDVVSKLAQDFFSFAEKSTVIMADFMYTAKLKFYSFLAQVDHRDLCMQSRCCDFHDPERFAQKPETCNKCKKKIPQK
ncbi:uncharacterized protein LOC128672451 isoform X2 [Plodia interpunctella]|nr:uncharacterized protein LOC128672451 isoform X2 [Plodia interpunctella]